MRIFRAVKLYKIQLFFSSAHSAGAVEYTDRREVRPHSQRVCSIILSIKQGGIKFHFMSLWLDSTWDWTPISWAFAEHSINKTRGSVIYLYKENLVLKKHNNSWFTIKPNQTKQNYSSLLATITRERTIIVWIFWCKCVVLCYREREREINSPTLLCLNQQSLRLTAKTVGEWRSISRTPWPAACWTKNGI